jgi:hypothetical protein
LLGAGPTMRVSARICLASLRRKAIRGAGTAAADDRTAQRVAEGFTPRVVARRQPTLSHGRRPLRRREHVAEYLERSVRGRMKDERRRLRGPALAFVRFRLSGTDAWLDSTGRRPRPKRDRLGRPAPERADCAGDKRPLQPRASRADQVRRAAYRYQSHPTDGVEHLSGG